MKELRTQLPFSWYETLANSRAGWTGDGQFLDLFIPAVKKLEDEDLGALILSCSYNYFLWSTLPGQIRRNLTANDIAIVREYIIRRLRTIAEEEKAELKAREALRKLKEELSKDPTYTGINKVASEENYNLFKMQNRKFNSIIYDDIIQSDSMTLDKVKQILEDLKKKGF